MMDFAELEREQHSHLRPRSWDAIFATIPPLCFPVRLQQEGRMPHKGRAVSILVVGSAVAIGACHDSTPTAPNATPASAELQQVGQASSPDQLAVARVVQGFGGFFLDKDGVPTVYMTDPRQRAVAERALAGTMRDLGFAPAQLRVLKGDFEYAQLDSWFTRALPALMAHPGAVFADLDEGSNRLRIGVATAAAEASASAELARLSIPSSAVIVQRAEPIHLAATLRNRVRPVRAGLQINFTNFLCTLGFNAIRSGVNSFLTASHCTITQGGVQGTVYHQPLASGTTNRIGVEVADPNYFTGGGCPAGRKCRFSDASRARYNAGVPFDLGGIARTTSRGNLSGSITINAANPFFNITAERANPVQGSQANKIGRTTGWTFGRITNTCVTVNVSGSNITQLCQSLVSAGVGAGDSGSPVFAWPGSGSNVTLLGILWGGNSLGNQFVFSPMSGIERELGALTTF
jgi:hypothetical protein